tara:strand:+ start:9659 stop:9793 length:135 start_codon:yes stop_codon:yes gene_type:complete
LILEEKKEEKPLKKKKEKTKSNTCNRVVVAGCVEPQFVYRMTRF